MSGEHGGHGHGALSDRLGLIAAAVSLALLLAGWALTSAAVIDETVARVLAVIAYALPAVFTVREVAGSLRRKKLDIDMLMLVASIGAAALGEWAEGALLLALFTLGHGLESFAMGRARQAIAALAELTPVTASVRRAGRVEEVGVEALVLGDVVVVRPHERLPADGFVVAGNSAVDQAPITGESVPVEKSPVADRAAAAAGGRLEPHNLVFAGSINGPGELDVQVTKKAGETMIARVVRAVETAETEQSPAQTFTERFVRVFVPSVLALTALLLLAGLVIDEPFSATFYRAMAVLVASSPCALAISVPSAVLSGVARAGRNGVLVKGGGPLEALGKVDVIAFDKTGTLTEGKPRLTDVVAAEGVTEEELLAVAVAVERSSDHPLARAIVRDGEVRLAGRPEPVAREVESIVARGVRAVVDGQRVYIGKAALFVEAGAPVDDRIASAVSKLEASGRSIMIVRQGERFLGTLGLLDTPRDSARAVVERLAALGVRRQVMLSGDHEQAAQAIARAVGISEAWGGLSPDDKLQAIGRLRAESRGVAMIGDGVNDAPAMAKASVGVAMGAAGSDVALETADVALMGDDLAQLPFVLDLGRRASRVIRQNLWVSIGAVGVLIPATLFGLGMGPAVLIHEGSTLVVVANALRLLRGGPAKGEAA